MTKPNDGGPAYPVVAQFDVLATGLTKREAFAMAAMQGMFANSDFSDSPPETIAKYSVEQADALLAELNKE